MSRRRVILVVAAAMVALAAVPIVWMLMPRAVPDFAAVRAQWLPSDAYLLDRHGTVIDQQRVDMGVRRLAWTPLSEISPALLDAVIAGEDRHFRRHHGVDWPALLGAARDDLFTDRRRGASTITMQLAAMLDPAISMQNRHPRGQLSRKLAQIRMARALEARWSKDEILDAYLNLLGFRGELQGVAAAAQMLAGKSPSGLTLPESLVLAALLPSPGSSTARVTARACARAAQRGLAQCAAITEAAHAMLDDDRARPQYAVTGPRMAPQLARAMLTRAGSRVQSTLDRPVQQMVQEILRQRLTGLASRNVRDGAALVVDNDTGDVLAYVASAGPNSSAHQVDGIRARRQAGSTLKPFLYEMALERHYLTAASLLDDSQIALDTGSGIYLPQDYDRDFKGLVSVRTALASSLNVPAVRTLVLVGVDPFRDRLVELGYGGIDQPGGFYGYSLALGSAEVSLWEQVQAYRTLARGGRASPIHVNRDAPVAGTAPSAFAADAAYIVSDILADRAARAVTFGLDNHLSTPFWSAVKTGTSKDMRDNWCIGFSRRFTVGVWVGNFEGDAMHDVSGVTGAAPVWHQIMLRLQAGIASPAPAVPAGVRMARTRFTPAVEPERNELFLASAGVAPLASVRAADEIARIATPANGMVIAMDPDIPVNQQRVPLSARGADAHMQLFLNGRLLGPADHAVLWAPEPGAHLLALEDAQGRQVDAAYFTVR